MLLFYYLTAFGVELFPVPYGGTSPIEGDLVVDREELVDFIISNANIYSDSTQTTFPDETINPEIGTEQNE